jgi:HAE1 family hydrophobic/amphiphilic exporter-1
LISRDYLVAQIEAFNDTLYDSFIYISEGNVDETKLEIAFIGPDEKYLRSRIKEIVQDFQGISMISKTILHFKEGAPVWNFKINHAKASNAGISISDIVNTLRWSLHGPVSVKWKDFNEEEIDLRVMAVRENYNNIDSIKKGTILNGDGKSIGLQELGNFQEIEDRNKIYRLNRQRAAYFSIHTPLKDIDLIYENLNELLNSKEKLPGYRFRIDPKLKQVKEKFLQLQILLIFAVLLIYMVIAAQYESVSTPLVLLLSIPLSVSIPLIVLWLTKQPMTTALLTAMIVVIGLVVNNVILLLDEITTRRQSVNKLTEQEIIFSLRKRILPMLLTTGSTLLGLIPLFLNKSDSSDLLHSLAFIVFWGILGSLFTAIFLIPGLIKTFPALIDRIPDFNKTKKELYNGVQLETANK